VQLPARLQNPDQVLLVLEEQIGALRRDRRLRTVERARAIAQLAALCLRVIETRDVGAKLEAVESVLRRRESANQDRHEGAA